MHQSFVSPAPLGPGNSRVFRIPAKSPGSTEADKNVEQQLYNEACYNVVELYVQMCIHMHLHVHVANKGVHFLTITYGVPWNMLC